MDVPLSHDPPCPWCGHSHYFLACESCDCAHHDRPGID